MASTSDFKNGLVLVIDGNLWSITEFQHVKPGKGPAFVRTTMKNVLTGKTIDKTFNAGVKVETATVDRTDMTYLYSDGQSFVFMEPNTFEQLEVDAGIVGDKADYLLNDQKVTIARHEGEVLYLELPAAVELTIANTDPGLQGDRSTGGTKPATMDTGAEIQVPLFLNTGDVVKVDTRSGEYISRVSS